MITYDRRAFAQAFLDAHPDAKHGYHYNEQFNTALREHRQRVLDGLQELFGLRLELDGVPGGQAALFMLFRTTASSYVKITRPGEGVGEAGLMYRQLAETRAQQHVLGGLERIAACNDRSRDAHLDVMETLIEVFLGERAGATVTSADLAAIGVDDTAGPNSSDYDLWEDY